MKGSRRAGRILSLLLIAAAWVIVLALGGCDHGDDESAGERSSTRPVAGAAPNDYLHGSGGAGDKNVVKVSLPAVPPAPKPTGPLPAGTSCVTAECHAKLASAAHVHGPVAEKACESCHSHDVGGHKYPLVRGTIETCTFCHARTAGTAGSHQHEPTKTSCTTCHEPHASPAKFLLKADNVEQLCAKCHTIPLKKFAHDPFAKGQCTLCHEPHQADNVKLLRGGGGNDHCFSCHGPMKLAMASASVVHKPAREACVTCHNPHSTDLPHFLKAPVQQTCLTSGCHDKVKQQMADAPVKHAAMTSDASCAACHNPHLSNQPHLLADRADRVCQTCHDKEQKTPDGRTIRNMKPALASQFLHGPVRVGNCAACHDPHGGQRNDLLARSFPETFYTRFDVKKYDLCFTCHEAGVVLTKKTTTLTNFRNGDTNLHYVHVNRDEKGRSCKTCHDVHGSDLPNHIANAVPFEGSRWAMPIEFRKTATGGSCTPGCHDTRKYDRGAAPALTAQPRPPTTRGAS